MLKFPTTKHQRVLKLELHLKELCGWSGSTLPCFSELVLDGYVLHKPLFFGLEKDLCFFGGVHHGVLEIHPASQVHKSINSHGR